MSITWKRSVLTEIEGLYCLEIFHTESGLKIAAASETHQGLCKMIDFDTGKEEIVWTGPGGCMNVAQWNEKGDIIAVQNFYKGGQAQEARVAAATRTGEGWQTRALAGFPFLHRCGVVQVAGESYVIASTLCTERKFAGDWSHPGKIHIFKVPKEGAEAEVHVIREGVVKNHGFWQGTLDGEPVTLVSGTELYCVRPPRETDGSWEVTTLFSREIGDVAVQDVDGDGKDEFFVFEGLHGNEASVYKRAGETWEKLYSCPMKFAHAIWGGTLLGKPSFVAGSMEGEKELYLLQTDCEGGQLRFERTVLETGIGPSNCRGLVYKGKSYILAAAREAGQLVMYELEESE
ncbi:MAG: hypothetical protein LUC99_06530 [Clostridiales bacterium]|nr:hypothetical protein [Clostridiales bacterium]